MLLEIGVNNMESWLEIRSQAPCHRFQIFFEILSRGLCFTPKGDDE